MANVITRVPWQACTGNFLPPLNSMVRDDQKTPAAGEEPRITVSNYINRLDRWLALPEEEVVSAFIAAASFVGQLPVEPQAVAHRNNAQEQELPGGITSSTVATQFDEATKLVVEPFQDQASSSTAIAGHMSMETEGLRADASKSEADEGMDTDDFEIQMDTMSGESGPMDVDEGSDVSQLEKEWRKGVAGHFVAHYTGMVSPYYHCRH